MTTVMFQLRDGSCETIEQVIVAVDIFARNGQWFNGVDKSLKEVVASGIKKGAKNPSMHLKVAMAAELMSFLGIILGEAREFEKEILKKVKK